MPGLMQQDILGSIELYAGAAGKAVTRAEAKIHCRVDADITEDDALIDGLIDAATVFCERDIWGHRQILTATYDLPVMQWWDGLLKIPIPPLQGVSIVYEDEDGDDQTLATTEYAVRTPWRQPGTIELLDTMPSVNADETFPITIRFTAGYLAPVTVVAGTDVFTSTGKPFRNGDRVRFYNTESTPDLPAGLSEGTDYYIISASGQTFSVATSVGGSAVDITDTGNGRHMCGWIPQTVKQAILLVVGHWYRNREAVGERVGTEVELAVKALLESEGWGNYA